MQYLRLSIEELKIQCKNWANTIQNTYHPDLIIYVAKGGFLIGYEFSKIMGVPMIGIETVREKGNGIKDFVAPVLRMLPDFIRNFFITVEIKNGIHERNSRRTVRFIDDCQSMQNELRQKILVVDDSVDTGASIAAVKEYVKKQFPCSDIKVAGFNVWDKSSQLVFTDFAFYRNTVIKSPMSKDSREYKIFINKYNDFQRNK